MDNVKNLKDILSEHLELKGLNFLRLQQLTGIPERYLEALLKGNFEKMPAAPYTRGYLMKIAEIFNLNGEELWQQYKRETEIKSSGLSDRLPENRFAIQSIKKEWLVMGIVIIGLIIYLSFNLPRIFGKPSLTILIPRAEISFSNQPTITVIGKISPSDVLKINKQNIPVDKTGRFEKTYNLLPGLNIFEFTAKRLLGKEIKIARQVIYQPTQ